ncbi:pentapeptide repeat-containing protein [Nocardia gamkensis]|uniref:pentapeptide repeat-containing protein n=1 Tax=Nocardia gamkensis TaxID=352869 RepID=UPI0037CA1214
MKHFEYRQNDREVRATIVRVITDRLQRRAESNWSANDFDFRTAYLENVEFTEAIFSGTTRFDDATFDGTTSFLLATSNGLTSFDRATFNSDAMFIATTFAGSSTSFDRATFNGDAVFGATAFIKKVSFAAATFTGTATFTGATFVNAVFSGTTFGAADFNRAAFAMYVLFSGLPSTGTPFFWEPLSVPSRSKRPPSTVTHRSIRQILVVVVQISSKLASQGEALFRAPTLAVSL